MKKIILLISVLVFTLLLPILILPSRHQMLDQSNGGIEYSNSYALKRVYRKESYSGPLVSDMNWKYIKNRLFDNKNSYAPRYGEAIGFKLIGATKHDSLIVDKLTNEVKKLNLIKIIKNPDAENLMSLYRGSNILTLRFNENFESLNEVGYEGLIYMNLDDGVQVTIPNSPFENDYSPFEKYTNWSTHSNINFNLKSDVSLIKREEIISYFFWKSFCKNRLKQEDIVDPRSTGSVNSVFKTSVYNPINYSFTDNDKFLLKKLYSVDFMDQFKEFLYENYSWSYAFNFLNYKLMRTFTLIISILIGVCIFILSFNLFYKNSKNGFFKYLLFFQAISISIANLYFFNKILKYEVYIDYVDVFGLNVFGLFIATCTAIIVWLSEKYLIHKKSSFSVEVILKMTFTFLAIQTSIFIFDYSLNKWLAFNYIHHDYSMITNIALILVLGRGLLIYLNHFSENLVKQKDVELSRLKQVNAQSELKLLQSHINPHFLYNALNSIAGLAHTNADKTEKMALSLSDLFRYSLNKKGQKMSTVKEEVTMVQNYLEIEKIRFGTRLKFNLHIDTELENEQIPMYMLQPLVENAIKHGISKIRGEGCIELEIKKEAQKLSITISDNGPDFPEGLVSGHGLQTVYDLLRLSYGDKASLSWENKPVKHIIIAISNDKV